MKYRLSLFGEVTLSDMDGRDCTPSSLKARAVLAILGEAYEAKVPREEIVNLLWGDREYSQGSASLRQSLRSIQDVGLLVSENDRLGLDLDSVYVERDPTKKPVGNDAFAAGLERIQDPGFESWLRDVRLRYEFNFDDGNSHFVRAQVNLVLRTSVGERIEFDSGLKRFKVSAATSLSERQISVILEKLRSAVSIFSRDDRTGNQYIALKEELEILELVLKDFQTDPAMVLFHCRRVLRRLQRKIDLGECPSCEQDANIEDFKEIVSEVVSSILLQDQGARSAFGNQSSVDVSKLSSDWLERIKLAADKVSEVSTGRLATELPKQARDLMDEELSDRQREESLVFVAGRLLRVWIMVGYARSKAVLEEIESVSKTLSGISENAAKVAALGVLVSAPSWLKPVIEYLVGLFGL